MTLFRKKQLPLNYIVFEVTSACNLACKYCYNHWKNPELDTNPVISSYQAAYNTLKRLFSTSAPQHITFTGGEPLLEDRLEELVLYCRMKGATVSIISNGNMGSIQKYSSLIKLGVDLFEFPIHSASSEVHDSMTSKEGTWEKSVQSINTVLKLGGNVVPVIVLTKFNCTNVVETLRFISSLGLNRIMLNRYNIGGLGMKFQDELLLSKKELNTVFKQANETAKSNSLQLSSNVCTPHCVVNPAHYPNIRFSNCSSDIRQRPLTLDAIGNLRFCNHSPTVIGNIFNEKIGSILSQPRNLLWGNTTPDYCKTCNLYEKCKGGCRAAAEQIGKTFDHVDPLVLLDN